MVYGSEYFDTDVSEVAELKDAKEQLMIYVKENQKLVNELKELRHSKNNIIHGINGYIELEDWDGLKKYFNEILEKTRNVSDPSLSSMEKILNPSLKDLLSSIFKKALSAGIDIKIMVDDNTFIEDNHINETDLCKALGEYLDNAIEAAAQAASKKISIYILNNEKSTSIIIENTFKEKPGKLLKNSTAAVTEAECSEPGVQPAGIILAKYPNVLNNKFIQHQVFVQEIQILR